MPISMRSHFVPALINSVSWVNDTVSREKYLKEHGNVARAAVGYLRNVAAQVALKSVMQYHFPGIDCREMSNRNHSYYYYEFTSSDFTFTISQVVRNTSMPQDALYRQLLMTRAQPTLFNFDDYVDESHYFLLTFNVENNGLVSARLGIPAEYNGKVKWKNNKCINLIKEPHLTPAELPAAVIDEPRVEFLNAMSEVLKDEK